MQVSKGIVRFWRRIAQTGIQDANNRILADKIWVSNQIAMIGLLINLLGLILSLVLFSFFAPLFFGATLGCLGTIFLNQVGKTLESRVLLSMTCLFLPFALHVSFINANEEPIVGMLAIMQVSWLIPWFLFRLSEWKISLSLSILGLGQYLLLDTVNPLVDIGFDAWILRQPQSEDIFFVTVSLLIAGIIALYNYRYDWLHQFAAKLSADHKQLQGLYDQIYTENQKMLAEHKQLYEQSEKRRWLVESLSTFNELFRKHNEDFDRLCDELVFALAKKVGACQIALFLTETHIEGKKLILKACYAYERKKFLTQEIKVNEKYADSLLMQSFLTKELIVISNLPDGYTSITSGIGEITPTNLLISPIKIEDNVLGIIEIASLSPFELQHRELISNICESFAYIVFNKYSLLQSQNLIQSMTSKEKEFEQLKTLIAEKDAALQLEQKEKAFLRDQISELFDALGGLYLVLGTDKRIAKVSNSFCQLLGYESHELIGQYLLKLSTGEEADLEVLHRMMDAALQLRREKAEQRFVKKNGDTLWFKVTYFPLKDITGNLTSILLVAQDMTSEKEALSRNIKLQRQVSELEIHLRRAEEAAEIYKQHLQNQG